MVKVANQVDDPTESKSLRLEVRRGPHQIDLLRQFVQNAIGIAR
jgi:hypothetical protein